MKNKILSTLVVFSVALSLVGAFGFTTSATTYETYGDWQYTVENGSITLTTYLGEDAEVEIPEKIGDVPITALNNTFAYNEKVTSVQIPDSITEIGYRTFYGCSKLEGIYIPKSVKTVGKEAFNWCDNLTRVDTEDIGAWCSIDFDGKYANPAYFTKELYLNDVLVTDIVVPEGTTRIGNYTFYGYDKLKSIKIHDGVTEIGVEAFRYCSVEKTDIESIEAWCNITFGDSGSNPIDCSGRLYLNGEEITKVEIPSTITKINDYLFNGFSYLTEVTIPDGVTEIGQGAFAGCGSLTKIEIPASVKKIGDAAFGTYCSISQVFITDIKAWIEIDFVDWRANPLHDGAALYLNGDILTHLEIPKGTKELYDNTFLGCSSITSVTLPEGLTAISGTFSGCKNLQSINIPKSITLMEGGAFEGCTKLKKVSIESLEAWCNIDFVAANTNNPAYMAKSLYMGDEIIKELVIPEGITQIRKYTFEDNDAITKVTFPKSLTTIEEYAFYCCDGLTSVIISNGVTKLAKDSFRNCQNLEFVYIPKSVTYMGKYAFLNCWSLKDVYYEGTEADWNKINFYNEDLTFEYETVIHYAAEQFAAYDEENDKIIVNVFGESENTQIITALYLDEKLIEFKYNTQNLTSGKNEFENTATKMRDADKLKIFVWDNNLSWLVKSCEVDLK